MADEITAAELDEVERLDKAATPGPWDSNEAYLWCGSSDGEDGAELFDLTPSGRPVDLELAAMMRTLGPRLARAHRRVCDERDSGILTDDIIAPAVAKAEAAAYAKGRREAIYDAAQILRGPYPELSRLTRGENFDSIRERCAASIERHEAEIRAGKTCGGSK